MVRTSIFLRIIVKLCLRAAEGKISWINLIQGRYGSIHFGKCCLWPYRSHRRFVTIFETYFKHYILISVLIGMKSEDASYFVLTVITISYSSPRV